MNQNSNEGFFNVKITEKFTEELSDQQFLELFLNPEGEPVQLVRSLLEVKADSNRIIAIANKTFRRI